LSNLPEWNSKEGRALRAEFKTTRRRFLPARDEGYGPFRHPFMNYDEMDQRLHAWTPPSTIHTGQWTPVPNNTEDHPMYAVVGPGGHIGTDSMSRHVKEYAVAVSSLDDLSEQVADTSEEDRWYFITDTSDYAKGSARYKCMDCFVSWASWFEDPDSILCFSCGEKGERGMLL